MSEAPDALRPDSRLQASDVVALFIRPREFFSRVDVDQRWWIVGALVLSGISMASGRVDQNIMRAELGQARPGWDALSTYLLGSWLSFWLFLLGAAALYGPFHWYVGGWWYRVRLRWSGAVAPDPRTARLVMVSASIVASLPTFLFLVGETLVFPDYGTAWASNELMALVFLVFPFWAVYVSYRGVRTRFDVHRWRSRIWFLFLPTLVILVVLGVVALLYVALFEPLIEGGGGSLAVSAAPFVASAA